MKTYPDRVEDYTSAFLVTTGLTLFVGLLTIAVLGGFRMVLIAAFACDLLFRVLNWRRRRSARLHLELQRQLS
ncbi:hypothetical protein [Pelagovum pacificum]|uniref:Uncharacterized protein n=1 Tax=Pelagovum pacificum TaxID=2588711 RepID=A0A5C5GA34_9RHOB|nr:hypothetical protein [Pelagovum pacificum]QQA41552.1 hypothetical protein I8N54_12030 [Pelagovum pacificum]TNY30832.1 hypothetical protein FHY64_17105 [Pelagovum pacificum]